MARSKYQRVRETFDALQRQLASVKDKTIAELRASFAQSLAQTDAAIAGGVAPSKFVAPFEQALVEFPSLLARLPNKVRQQALAALHSSLAAHHPRLLSEQEARLLKVLRRGSIRTEAEFHLVRQRIDEMEALSSSKELAELYALVDTFEAKGGA